MKENKNVLPSDFVFTRETCIQPHLSNIQVQESPQVKPVDLHPTHFKTVWISIHNYALLHSPSDGLRISKYFKSIVLKRIL